MPIVTTAYDIPEEILSKILSGEHKRFGSVVRNGRQIYTHLKEVSVPTEGVDIDELRSAAAASLKNPKVLLGLGAAVAVTVVTASGVAYWAGTKKAKVANTPEVASTPRSVLEYNAALRAYLEAVQSGTIDSAVLERLDSALEALQSESRDGDLTLDFSTEQSTALVSLVTDYTRKLAEANEVQFGEVPEAPTTSDGNPIVDLRYRLEIQKRIIDDAA
ncbi:hypothetical protein [Nesterenkonia massiliensis]|uniref:hypothetical protein n=1 Tax=Nesterenkonia massiliensis TaxID=1232429 RepID=UPI0005C8CA74|nr:hypothetical protein [Nesterenkonia massiliensis]